MPKIIILHEYVDPTLTLSGPAINIIAAWYGVPRRPDRNQDVTQRLTADLARQGYVRLSPCPLVLGIDPAVLQAKRLVVVFDGDNECILYNTVWVVLGRLASTLLTKVTLNAAVLCVSGAAAASATTPAGVVVGALGLASAAYAGYQTRRKSAAVGTLDCAICLEQMTFSDDMGVLQCGHCFHTECVRGWAHKQGRSCPLCQGEALPILDLSGSDFSSSHGFAIAELAAQGFCTVLTMASEASHTIKVAESIDLVVENTPVVEASDAFHHAVHHVLDTADWARLLLWV